MQYTYNGNQLKQIIDNGTSYGYPAGTTTYMYDLNGNNTLEGTRTRIAYNEINLPQQVQLLGGRGIKNVYAADGRKLKSEAKQGSEYIKEGTKTYCGNLVFDINDELDYILFNEGRILYNVDDSTFSFEYHLRDHLGSTRVAFVPTTSGTDIVQENAYYPFGAPVADLSWSPKSTNRYLREGKEYISDFDWNKYDFTGRTFDPWTLRALQVDPMTAGYYSISPYALFLNNPLRVIDPTGWIVDWYEDLDKTMQFDPKVKSQKDLKDGQRYVGETYQIRNMNGKITEDYRADGSIMFANETSAYNRMWSQATAKKVEESGYALENGKFLVLPDYKNEVDDATPSKYDYSVKDGILLTSDGEILKTIGNVHTHQDPSKNATPSFWTGTGWGDIGHSKAMGGLPIITIGHDGNIHGAFWSIKDSGFRSIPGFGSRKDLLSGNTKLIPWLKTYPTRGK
jgi:RHS repeat-associated protein